MDGVEQLASTVGFQTACRALDVSRSSFYRRRRSPAKPPAVTRPRPASPRRLSEAERQQVLDLLHSNRFVDAAPAQVYAALLDEDTYLCSERTMYRLLQSQQEVRERRNQLRHPAYSKPELLATAPNQVWSWISPSCAAQPRGSTTASTSCSTSSAATSSAGCWPARGPEPGQPAPGRNHSTTAGPARPAHHPCRSRRRHDLQGFGAAAGRSGRSQEPQPTSYQR